MIISRFEQAKLPVVPGISEDVVRTIQSLSIKGKQPKQILFHPSLMDSNITEDDVTRVLFELEQAKAHANNPTNKQGSYPFASGQPTTYTGSPIASQSSSIPSPKANVQYNSYSNPTNATAPSFPLKTQQVIILI